MINILKSFPFWSACDIIIVLKDLTNMHGNYYILSHSLGGVSKYCIKFKMNSRSMEFKKIIEKNNKYLMIISIIEIIFCDKSQYMHLRHFINCWCKYMEHVSVGSFICLGVCRKSNKLLCYHRAAWLAFLWCIMTGKFTFISDEWINYILEKIKKGLANLWSVLITLLLLLLGLVAYL